MRTFLLYALLLLLLIAGCAPPVSQNTDPTTGDESTVAPAATLPAPTESVASTETPQPGATETLTAAVPTLTAIPSPQPTAQALLPLPGPPHPVEVSFCDAIPRPAILFQDVVEIESSQTSYLALNPEEAFWCRLVLPNYPADDPIGVQGSLFYPVADLEAGTMTIWQMYPDRHAEPWNVTTTAIEVPYTPYAFAVSPDGSNVAWSTFAPDSTSARLVVTLWTAQAGDEEPRRLLQRETAFDDPWGDRPLYPLRFSADNQTLYFTWAPIGLGGMWTGFYGRYDNLLTLATDGSAAEGTLIFDCAGVSEFLCLGDFMPEEALAYTVWSDDWRIEISDWSGQSLQSITLEGVGHAGYPTFSPAGMLAYTGAQLAEQYPDQTTVYLVAQPLAGNPESVYQAPGIEMLWSWLNDAFLVANSVEPDRSTQTSVIRLDGLQLGEVQTYPHFYVASVP